MNELVIVHVDEGVNSFINTGVWSTKKKVGKKKKKISLYLNNLLQQHKYELNVYNSNSKFIEVVMHYHGMQMYFGIISRSRNKKIFDKIYLEARLRNE